MQVPNHKQWWSNLWQQLSHLAQWDALGGLTILHVKQYVNFTKEPFDTIVKSVFLLYNPFAPICLGIIPGSKHPPFAIAKSIIAYRIIKTANI